MTVGFECGVLVPPAPNAAIGEKQTVDTTKNAAANKRHRNKPACIFTYRHYSERMRTPMDWAEVG
jgi:hypothetical protein